jgi:pimeloyl-ACP methyl ester carboxylesterase
MNRIVGLAAILLFCANARAQAISQPDASQPKSQFVTVATDVKLEVVDWGGNGRPIIFLPGLNASAHSFDVLAAQFTSSHHVYGITRRGMAPSSIPAATDQNYDADRLGDDVLAVMKVLNISRPVLAGESIGGQELSSIGERYPDAVAGLVYLDATGPFAFYVPNSNSMAVDIATVRRDLTQLPKEALSPSRSLALIRQIQDALPSLQSGLTQYANILTTLKELPAVEETPQQMAANAIQANPRKYTAIKAPILAIIAVPHACAPNCEKPSVKALAQEDEKRADAFAAGNPNARIVRLAYAQHEIYRSNEADVVRQMNSFMGSLH